MKSDFFIGSVINLLFNLSYTVITLLVAVVSLILLDKYLLKTIDIQEELKQNNIAVSIFASSILFFVAIIISFALT